MTKPTQLMPELLIMREMASKRCPYCHAPEGEPHACNCWAPNGSHAGDIVIPRDDIAMLIEDNEDLRAEVERLTATNGKWYPREKYNALRAENARLREALEYIATNTTHYKHEWVRKYARAALEDNK